MGDHNYAGFTDPIGDGRGSTAPPGLLKEEILDELEKRLDNKGEPGQDAKKFSAIEVELEILRPIWHKAISEENQGANDEQLRTLVDLKLEQARQMIPARWTAEKKFKDDCQMVQQIQTNFEQVLDNLQTKEVTDPSAQIEDHQAKRLIQDWEIGRLPQFEANFKEATRVWYKPNRDPLTTTYSTTMNKFANLMARFEYETSIRPVLNNLSNQESDKSPPNAKDVVTMDRFHIRGKIKPFEGDLSDPKVLVEFAQWKNDWECLAKDMESLPGFSKIGLFRKLKKALSDRAYRLVNRYPSDGPDSYDKAMQGLIDKFENPMNIAAYYIKSGLNKKKSKLDQLEAIKESLKSLQRVKDTFEKEKVDMFNFALTCTFTRSMTAEEEENWYQFKSQAMREYNKKREEAAQAGEILPEWNFGMVDNYEKFNAWLEKQEAQYKQEESERDCEQKLLTIRELTSQHSKETCFLCGPNETNHHLTRCPVGLAMSFQEWRRVCRNVSFCYKCARPMEGNHQCNISCRLCNGRRNDVDHHVLMCPLSPYRTAPLIQDRDIRGASRSEGKKHCTRYNPRTDARNARDSPLNERSRSFRRNNLENEEELYFRERERSPLHLSRYQRR